MLENFKQVHPIRYKYLFTVTTFSKYLALSMLIIFPILGFYLGMFYNKTNNPVVNLDKPYFPQPNLNSENLGVTNNSVKPCTISPSESNRPVDNKYLNWNTYTSLKGFSIKYPQGWVVKKIAMGISVELISISVIPNPSSTEEMIGGIWVTDNPKASVDDYYNYVKKDTFNSLASGPIRDVTLGGCRGIVYYKHEPFETPQWEHYFTVYNNKSYEIWRYNSDYDKKNYAEITKNWTDLINSLKFTN